MRIAICAAAASLLLPQAGARRTVKQKKQAALVQFENAEKMRAALERKPESRRSRDDYEQILDAYRSVYHTAPNSSKADTSIVIVAELLDEQGRVLRDLKSYGDSIGQLVFLRREYPGSKYRVAALFTIGEIYRDDLRDRVQAKATFEDYLKHYPNSGLAPDARAALAELADGEKSDPFEKRSARAKIEPVQAKAVWADLAPPKRQANAETSARASDDAAPSTPGRKRTSEPESAANKPATDEEGTVTVLQPQVDVALDKTDAPKQPRKLAHLTGVRHWSTPDYTRVAIDLEQEVEYQAGRVPNPDRIFFDLYNVRLTSELINGKAFDVGSGFLHRIRVAQYSANMARVVLDVDDVAEYSAFLLPNPYRLIIDIHGKMPPQQAADTKAKPGAKAANGKDKDKDAGTTAAAKDARASGSDAGGSDVTVTHLKPDAGFKPADPAGAAIERAEKAPAGPLKPRESQEAKPREGAPAKSADKNPPSNDKPVQAASAEPRRLAGDDAAMDATAEASGKPTTGPTFQAVAPQESSRARKKAQPAAVTSATRVAEPTANGDRSLTRVLGLKIGKIVIDAGHGGHDTGTVGPNGLMEKDLVLDVALKLGKLLESRLGAEVVYTRDDDTFIPLETRTAIANKEEADLFISIHANSSSDESARGVETYYLNFTSSRDALEVAARENSVSEKSIHELQDLVKKIALKDKIEESRELAADVQRSLYAGLSAKSPAIRNRGVKKAPFIVLIGANMPSILAEISFVSNPADERKLKTGEYRQRVAESLYKGIHRYVNSLSGVKVTAKTQDAQNPRGAAALAAR
jgi:N-acetylmuramoyl-L-alanine amidase